MQLSEIVKDYYLKIKDEKGNVKKGYAVLYGNYTEYTIEWAWMKQKEGYKLILDIVIVKTGIKQKYFREVNFSDISYKNILDSIISY